MEALTGPSLPNTLASRPPPPVTSLYPPRSSSIHLARGLSIRTAKLLCRLIDSLSKVRYSTWYGFNFMPIISVQRQANRSTEHAKERRMNICDTSRCSFLFQDSRNREIKKNHNQCVLTGHNCVFSLFSLFPRSPSLSH